MHSQSEKKYMINSMIFEKSVALFLSTLKDNKRKAKTAYRDAKSALIGKVKHPKGGKAPLCSGGSIIYFRNILSIFNTSELTVKHLKEYNEIMWEECPQTTRNKKFSQLRKYLKWAIKNHHVSLTESDLKELEQRQYFPPKAELPPRIFLDTISDPKSMAYSGTNFIKLRDFLILHFCCCANGVRPGIEVCNLNIKDVDIKNCEISIRRKRSKEGAIRLQTISFRKDFTPFLNDYIRERENILNSYPTVTEDNEALFIKDNPLLVGRKADSENERSWRLCEGTIRKIFVDACSRANIPHFRPYLMRHASVTMQVTNARLLGIDVNEVAFRNDHIVEICLKYYNDLLRAGVEILTREDSELTDFIEKMACHHLTLFAQNPHQLRHFAAYKEAIRILGNLQLSETLKSYRNDSYNPFDNSNNADRLKGFLSEKNIDHQNVTWQSSLGHLIRKNMFNI